MNQIRVLCFGVFVAVVGVLFLVKDAQAVSFYVDGGLGVTSLSEASIKYEVSEFANEGYKTLDVGDALVKYNLTFGVLFPLKSKRLNIGIEHAFDYTPFEARTTLSDGPIANKAKNSLTTNGQIVNNTLNALLSFSLLPKLDVFASVGLGYYVTQADTVWKFEYIGISESGTITNSIYDSGLSLRHGIGGVYQITKLIGLKLGAYYNVYLGAEAFLYSLDVLGQVRFKF
jgi:opacity protein-like surface antigen